MEKNESAATPRAPVDGTPPRASNDGATPRAAHAAEPNLASVVSQRRLQRAMSRDSALTPRVTQPETSTIDSLPGTEVWVERVVQPLLKWFDADATGQVSLLGFLRRVRESGSSTAAAMQIFTLLDADGSRQVSRAELRQGLLQVSTNPALQPLIEYAAACERLAPEHLPSPPLRLAANRHWLMALHNLHLLHLGSK